jgi:elongation factor G
LEHYTTEKLRNLALIGHGGSGKTSLAEALLYFSGNIKRLGSVVEGNSTCDFDPEEIRRKISVSASLAPCEWKNHKINVIDTPGYFDFVGEVVASLQSVDSAISVVCAASGVEVGTELTWAYADKFPKFVFINKMDRENANFSQTLSKLQELFGKSVVTTQIPIGAAESFKGYVDLVAMKAYIWNNGKAQESDIPKELEDEAEELRLALIEAAASADDELTMKFLEDEPLTTEEIMSGMREGVKAGAVVPVFCGSSISGIGIEALLNAVIQLMPSPADCKYEAFNTKTNEKVKIESSSQGPLVAQVFKTLADPYVGKMSLFRVYSGVLKSDSTIFNTQRNREERIGQIFSLRGKEQIQTTQAVAGDIAVVAKLQETTTGDTFSSKDAALAMPKIGFPAPAITMAAQPKSKGDEEKISSSLARLAEEDPTISVEKSAITGQTLISGMGDIHIEVIVSKLKAKFGVDVELTTPKVPYQETVRKTVQSEYKHKKQSGGRGQYGHVIIELAPLTNGQEFEFIDKIFGGAVPRQYIPAVEKGVRDTMAEGVLAGYPVVGIQLSLLDGSYHSVDSSEMAFKIAASMAFKKGFLEAQPVLLEPILNVEVTVPDTFMGDIIGDLNKKRGRILGMEPEGNMQVIRAQVPQAEMFRYAIDLRSITQGRGNFKTEFYQYEEVPAQIAEQVIAQAKIDKES